MSGGRCRSALQRRTCQLRIMRDMVPLAHRKQAVHAGYPHPPIRSMRVEIDISHTYRSDLHVALHRGDEVGLAISSWLSPL